MTKQHDVDKQVQIMPIGDLRMIGLNLPEPLQNRPDEEILCLPLETAEKWVAKILSHWNVPEEETRNFIPLLSNESLSDIIVIHQLIRVIFSQNTPRAFIHAKNKAFDNRSAWDLVSTGSTQRVRAHLAHLVYNGGW